MQKERIGNCILYQANSYELVKQLPKHKITLIHTDPPYDYKDGIGKPKKDVGGFMRKLGFDKSQDKIFDGVMEDFDYSKIQLLQELLKAKANFQFWCNKRQVFRYLEIATQQKWNWQDICLYRNNALPNVRGKYQDKDYCLHLWSGRPLTGSYNNKRTDYHWSIGGKKEWNHPCLKPLEPIMNMLQVGSDEGDIVLDPFMGSGTTGEACIRTNRKFLGIEREEKYFQMSCERLSKVWKEINGSA